MIKPEDIRIGAKVKHNAYKDSTYTITDIICRIETNNTCHHVICYSPNYTSAYIRFALDIDDFMSNFELVKE